MKFVYFASLREKIGKREEEITLPPDIKTVAQLLDFLSAQGENYARALGDRARVRVALDRVHVEEESALEGVSEVALFPPMTGG